MLKAAVIMSKKFLQSIGSFIIELSYAKASSKAFCLPLSVFKSCHSSNGKLSI